MREIQKPTQGGNMTREDILNAQKKKRTKCLVYTRVM